MRKTVIISILMIALLIALVSTTIAEPESAINEKLLNESNLTYVYCELNEHRQSFSHENGFVNNKGINMFKNFAFEKRVEGNNLIECPFDNIKQNNSAINMNLSQKNVERKRSIIASNMSKLNEDGIKDFVNNRTNMSEIGSNQRGSHKEFNETGMPENVRNRIKHFFEHRGSIRT